MLNFNLDFGAAMKLEPAARMQRRDQITLSNYNFSYYFEVLIESD
jgi:hypothetical protein